MEPEGAGWSALRDAQRGPSAGGEKHQLCLRYMQSAPEVEMPKGHEWYGVDSMPYPHLPDDDLMNSYLVCGVERVVGAGDNGRDWKGLVTGIIPIAGDYHAGTPSSRALDPKVTTLKSGVDSRVLGLRVELHGGQYPFDLDGGKTNSNTTGRKQTAIIDLQCDPTRPKPGPRFKKHGEAGALAGHREEGASQDDSWPNQRCEGFLETSTSSNSSHKNTSDIRFISYGPGGDNNNNDVLHLEWLTKYACENINNHNDSDNNDENDKSSHWGFFTWVIIM